jgi:hypothetical protein
MVAELALLLLAGALWYTFNKLRQLAALSARLAAAELAIAEAVARADNQANYQRRMYAMLCNIERRLGMRLN